MSWISAARNIIWLFAVLCFTFQCPFAFLQKFIIPVFFVFILLELGNMKLLNNGNVKIFSLYIVYFAYLSAIFLFSVNKGNNVAWAIRFYMILLVIPLCLFIRDEHFETEERAFFGLSAAKSLMLIFIAAMVYKTNDVARFSQWARSNAFGSIYVDHGFLKVQLDGNSLLVVAFILNFEKHRRFTLTNIVLLAGILVSGNFAFMLGLFAYVLYKVGNALISKKARRIRIKRKPFLIMATFAGFLAMFAAVLIVMEWKRDYSNLIRVIQAKMLLRANPIIGNGLGNRVQLIAMSEDMRIRFERYTYYYELQTLYIFNQIGLAGLSLFYLITLGLARRNGHACFWLYLIYLFYSFWNPYCFDTTQMIAIMAIMNLGVPRGQEPSRASQHGRAGPRPGAIRKEYAYGIRNQDLCRLPQQGICSRQQVPRPDSGGV